MDIIRVPAALRIRQQSRVLEVEFDDGLMFSLPFEFLRVHSPSAEVRGHVVGQEVLQTGKRDVGITTILPVGNYGMKPVFSDGHESGIYTWSYLYQLGQEQADLWQQYLASLRAAGYPGDSGRDVPMLVAGKHCH